MEKLVKRLERKAIRAYECTFNRNYTLEAAEEDVREEFGGRSASYTSSLVDTLTHALPAWIRGHLNPNMPNNEERIVTQNLVFVIHGLGENGKMFSKLRSTGDKLWEQEIVPISYDDHKEFKTYAFDVLETMNKTLDRSLVRNVYAIGHSTGADILRYLSSKNKLGILEGVVLAAPLTNGKVPDIMDKIVFGRKSDYANPHTALGYEITEELKAPLSVNGITISYLNDSFIPLRSSLDINGRNLVVSCMGHLAGTGGHRKGNEVYLEVLEEVKKISRQ